MKKLRRTTKYMIVICAVLFVLMVILGYVLTRQSDRAIRTLIDSRMLDISNTAAAMLDGDAVRDLQAEDADSPAWRQIYTTLSYFQENMDLAHICCVRAAGDGQFVFVVDPSEDPGQFGESVVYTDALARAWQGQAGVDQEPYADRWGRFYSAYSPVYDSAGQVSGIVAVDFSASWYETQLHAQIRTGFAVSIISMILVGIVITMIVTRFRRTFRIMLEEMNQVSDSIETLVQEVSPGSATDHSESRAYDGAQDELVALGDRIRSMENQLRGQISFVRSQAYTDPLTGLGNRTAYEDHVNRLQDSIQAHLAAFTVVLVDLNGLKRINDNLGHDQGDAAIRQVADGLQVAFKEANLYRIGGDEFVVILEGRTIDVESRLSLLSGYLADHGDLAAAKG